MRRTPPINPTLNAGLYLYFCTVYPLCLTPALCCLFALNYSTSLTSASFHFYLPTYIPLHYFSYLHQNYHSFIMNDEMDDQPVGSPSNEPPLPLETP